MAIFFNFEYYPLFDNDLLFILPLLLLTFELEEE